MILQELMKKYNEEIGPIPAIYVEGIPDDELVKVFEKALKEGKEIGEFLPDDVIV